MMYENDLCAVPFLFDIMKSVTYTDLKDSLCIADFSLTYFMHIYNLLDLRKKEDSSKLKNVVSAYSGK